MSAKHTVGRLEYRMGELLDTSSKVIATVNKRDGLRMEHRWNMHDELVEALKLVEEWWLREGMEHFHGAPACIFTTRDILSKARSEP